MEPIDVANKFGPDYNKYLQSLVSVTKKHWDRQLNVLADEAGISLSFLSEILSGKKKPSYLKQRNLTKAAWSRVVEDSELSGQPQISTPKNKYDLHGDWQPHKMDMEDEEYTLIGQTFNILRSDTPYKTALIHNIRAFHRAIKVEGVKNEQIEKLNDDIQERRDRLEKLEKLGREPPAWKEADSS